MTSKSPCDGCAKREACATICGKVEALLPGVTSGDRRHVSLHRIDPLRIASKDKEPASSMTPRERLIVELYHRNDWSTREIAYALGIKVEAVRVLAFKGKQKLMDMDRAMRICIS